jgi:antitoxin component YwqK of YwqJK toxin-antitoxin module
MDFLVQQARFLSRVLLVCILLFQGCNEKNVPDEWVNETAHKLIAKQGITYYQSTPFSGWVFTLYSTGDTSHVVSYLHGKKHGRERSWYANRTMKEHRYYDHGNKTTLHKGWYEDGSPKFLYHFKNDVYHGNVQEWLPDKTLYLNFNYENGQENGLQQMWETDGRIKANYEVRNGRRYGFSGSKNCKTVTP